MKEEKTNERNRTKTVIAWLAVTAFLVIASVVVMSLYFTGVFDDAIRVRKQKSESEKESAAVQYLEYNVPTPLPTGRYARIRFACGESKYEIDVYLLSNYAPNTVSNFVSYASAGFYDGTAFGADETLLQEGKVVCGGYVRNSDGTIAQKIPTESAPIRGEFYENGYENNRLSNVKGMIGMIHSARSNDDATTDFYLLSEDAPEMNGKYAAFGKITTTDGINSLRVLTQKAKNGETVTIEQISIYTRK